LRVHLERHVVVVAADLAGRHRSCLRFPRRPRSPAYPARPGSTARLTCGGHARCGGVSTGVRPVTRARNAAFLRSARPNRPGRAPMTVTTQAARGDRARPPRGRWIEDWRPEDPAFWTAR